MIDNNSKKQLAKKIWDKYKDLLKTLSESLKIDPIITASVLCVESSGQGFANGKMIIRFENHIFWKFWGKFHSDIFNQFFKFDLNKKWQGHQFRRTVVDDWVDFHNKGQKGEWEAFNFAYSFDSHFALCSISIGMPQLMGFNYKKVGYDSIEEMFKDFSSGEDKQIVGLFEFINNTPNAISALQKEDFVTFAKLYNGSGQAEVYANKIREYFDIFKEIVS